MLRLIGVFVLAISAFAIAQTQIERDTISGGNADAMVALAKPVQ